MLIGLGVIGSFKKEVTTRKKKKKKFSMCDVMKRASLQIERPLLLKQAAELLTATPIAHWR